MLPLDPLDNFRRFRFVEPKHDPQPPTIGDRVLAASQRLKIDIWRMTPDEDGEPAETCVDFTIEGSLPEGESAAVLADLLAKFRTPRGEEGAA